MTANHFRELMISILELQKTYYDPAENNSEYREGIVRGLDIAIEKLHQSAFLTEEE